MNKQSFYLSAAIPYVNGTPHIGHALEFIQADAIVRYQRLLGKDVFFLMGTDENSLKNVQAAEKAGEDTQAFVDRHAAIFDGLKEVLNLSYDDFIRTTEERHFKGAQKLWSACKEEDIYKKKYKGLYCVGCEAFYKEDDLIDGKCPEHKKILEEVEEENYFFKLSNYQEQIKDLLENDKIKIVPENRKNEVLSFIKDGLEDFSISRSVERARGWGVPVPGDDSQIMYVWFDALSNYINALDYENEGELYKKFWLQAEAENREVVHAIGKGIVRFHALYWIGMLLSAEIPLPTHEFVHGYITVDGEKMSKSIGNVVKPEDVAAKYGSDAMRYYFLGAISAYQDGDFSYEKMDEYYASMLANGVGNLTSRVLTMLEKYNESKVPAVAEDIFDTNSFWQNYKTAFSLYSFHDVIKELNALVSACDAALSEQKPWEKANKGEDISVLLYQLAECLRHIGIALMPIIPKASTKILSQLGINVCDLDVLKVEQRWGKLKEGTTVTKGDALFPRLS